MAGRAGVDLTLDDFDAISRRVPWLANIRPSGTYLMDDFYTAGGLPALLGQLATVPGALHLRRMTANGHPFGENISDLPVHDPDVIRSPGTALAAEGGVAVLRGNLAPDGAVIKHIAAEPRLVKHTGPAVVFDDYADLQKRINDPALNITADSVLVLRNAGPKGGPGMPEYGMLPIPDHLLKQGVRDMVRISDARMSGTSYGACALHVAPESYVGGPLALVTTGDLSTPCASRKRLLPKGKPHRERRPVMAQAAAVAKPPAPPRRRRASATPRRLPYLLIAPAALLMLGFIAYPVISVFYYSLQNFNPTKPWRNGYAGFDNFVQIFTKDPQFWDTLTFSAKWVFVEVGLQL